MSDEIETQFIRAKILEIKPESYRVLLQVIEAPEDLEDRCRIRYRADKVLELCGTALHWPWKDKRLKPGDICNVGLSAYKVFGTHWRARVKSVEKVMKIKVVE